jgi:endogenous inhibitor of DNA gyrase (YacG/DUF329 family)
LTRAARGARVPSWPNFPSAQGSNLNQPTARTPCPICRRLVAGDCPSRPFCSPRCRQIDLNRWLGEAYSITRLMDPEEESPEELPPDPDPDDN